MKRSDLDCSQSLSQSIVFAFRSLGKYPQGSEYAVTPTCTYVTIDVKRKLYFITLSAMPKPFLLILRMPAQVAGRVESHQTRLQAYPKLFLCAI